MNATIVQAVVRHLLTTVGGGFLAGFGITGDAQQAVIGAITTLVGVVWSIYDKKKQPTV